MRIKKTLSSAALFIGCGLYSSFILAASTFEDGTLSIPYVAFNNLGYSAKLVYVTGTDPLDFSLSEVTLLDETTVVPSTAATYSDNILNIPILIADNETYTVQLDYIEAGNVYRLVETPAQIVNSTADVFCDYIDSTENTSANLSITSTSSWTCSDNERAIIANGVPDHEIGENFSGRSEILAQTISDSFTLAPKSTNTVTNLGGPRGVVAYVLNGVKVDPGTAGTCNDAGDECDLAMNVGMWSIEALGQDSFRFGTDQNNAHVQGQGTYHYHGMPEGFVAKRGGNSSTMTLIAWAADGFPIYARYGYSDPFDSNSAMKTIKGSYQLVEAVEASRPPVETYALGTFSQDWEFVKGSGDLDECNGRIGVTPEFPAGIYHYFATDSYPYFQRCVKGAVEANGRPEPPAAP